MGKIVFHKAGTTFSRKHYEASRQRLVRFFTDENTNRHWKIQKRNVLKLLEIKSGDSFLDIGCGSGKYEVLISKVAKVTALDISEDALKTVQLLVEQFGKPENVKTKLFKRPLNSLLSNEKFNKIMMIDSSEHMPRDLFMEMLDDIKGLLMDGGVFLIYTPNRTSIYELLRRTPGHINLMTMDEMIGTLKKKGFEVLECYYEFSHHLILNRLERLLPGGLFKRRLCIRAGIRSIPCQR